MQNRVFQRKYSKTYDFQNQPTTNYTYISTQAPQANKYTLCKHLSTHILIYNITKIVLAILKLKLKYL